MKRTDWILITVIAVASCAWCWSSSVRLGATFDEPFYLDSGMDYWHRGHFGRLLAAGTMPLAPHLQTLPIYIVERTTGRELSVQTDLGTMLQLARPVTLLFWIVLLAATMRLGRLFGGDWGGRAALLLIGVEPNFLAHASLATTDIAVAACFTAFVGQYLDGRQRSPLFRLLLPSLWLGLAITAKVSALALLPFAMIASLLYERPDHIAVRRWAADTAIILAIGGLFAVLYCGTGGQTWLHGTLATMPPDHWLRPAVASLGSLRLFPNAIYAIWFQFAHNTAGQAVYIAGAAATSAVWFYLPLLLLIKLTLPLVAAITIALATGKSRVRNALIGVMLLIAAMLLFRVQTGIRFVLPLVVVVVAWAAARLAALLSPARSRWRTAAAALVGTWMVIEAGVAWPDGLRYVNEAWGGTDRGAFVVSDSNYDWGQGLPELAEWRRLHDVPLAVWYFGTDTRFPEIVRYDPRQQGSDRSVIEGRALAVSSSLLYGGYLESPGPARDAITRLRSTEPIARTSTFFVFQDGVSAVTGLPAAPAPPPSPAAAPAVRQ